jgi:PPOX class probable F420-dependent enzyme
MSEQEARARFDLARVARLATVDASGRPHLVPTVFAVDHDTLYSAVDHKPKRTTALRRLANIAANPAVSVLVDHYDDADWQELWWARADGSARVLAADDPDARRGVALLVARYPQYVDRPPDGAVIAVAVERWLSWSG